MLFGKRTNTSFGRVSNPSICFLRLYVYTMPLLYSIYYEASSRHLVSCKRNKLLNIAHPCYSGLLANFTNGFSGRATLATVGSFIHGVICLQPILISSSGQHMDGDLHREDLFRRIFWTCQIIERFVTSES